MLSLYQSVSKEILQGCTPDACILLDISPETGAARVHSRPEEPTRFDKEALDFHARVREGLKKHAGEFGQVFLIDAEKPLEEVWKEVLKIVKSLV